MFDSRALARAAPVKLNTIQSSVPEPFHAARAAETNQDLFRQLK